LSTIQEQHNRLADGATHLKETPTAELLIAIWRHRYWLVKVTALGLLIAIGVALLLPNEYTSTVRLMPPNPQAFSSPSMLAGLGAGGAYSSALAGAGGIMSERTPGETAIAVLSSRTVMDEIIDRFDLRKVYHSKYDSDAAIVLAQRTTFAEDMKSGIITITVTDRDKNRAHDIAGAFVDELNKLVSELSTSSARRERIFLEQRLKSVEDSLNTSSRELSQFSSRNATLDFQKQGEATVEAAGHLQGELISAEGELSALKAQYSDDNVRVRAARRRVDVLQNQLKTMSGTSGNNSSGSSDGSEITADQILPSVRELPLLGFTYSNLSRQVAMLNAIDETLTKQYELAKVQEVMEIPHIMMLDAPSIPDRKSSPHRLMIAFVGAWLSLLAGIAWITASKYWMRIDDSHPVRALTAVLLRTVREGRRAKVT